MRQKPFFILVLLVGSCATPIEQGAGTVSAGGANPSSAGSLNSAGSIASGGATGNAGATNSVDPLGAGGLPAGAGGTATDGAGAAGMDSGASGDGGGGTSGSGGQSDAGGSAGSTAGSGTAGGAGKAGSSGASGTGNAGAGGVSGAGGRGNGGAAGIGGAAGAGNGAGTAGVSGAGNGGTAGSGGAGGAAGAGGAGGAGGGACVLGTAFSAQFWTATAPTALPSGTFRITNNSGVDVSYGAIEVRYYLTNEETAALTPIFVTFNHFRPAGFSAGTIGNVHGSYLPLTPAAPGANTYLSITVFAGEGSFVAGENAVIGFYSALAMGPSKTNQTGDYSYDGHATADPGPSGAPSSKVTLYVNGVLSWGCQP